MKIFDYCHHLSLEIFRTNTAPARRRAFAVAVAALLLVAITHAAISAFDGAENFRESAIAGGVSPIGFEAASDGGWKATKTENGFHALLNPVKIEPHAYYRISFDVRQLPRERVVITSDLIASGYDNPEQELTKAFGITDLHRPVQFTINTGNSPTAAVLRVFYSGQQGAQVANINIVKIPTWWIWFKRFMSAVTTIVVVASLWFVVATQLKNALQNKEIIVLVTVYLAVVLLRFLSFVFTPYSSGDEYIYKSLAAAIWQFGTLSQLTGSMISDPVDIPNLIYPFLISPAFAAGEDFYVVVRLINSAIINLALFPAYFLARRFVGERSALAVAALSVAIPFVNFGAYAVTEVIFYPVFLLCIWLLVEVISSPSKVWLAIAFGGFAGLLLNIRLTGMIVIPAYMVCSLWAAWREEGFREWFTRPRWIIPLISFAVTFTLLQWITRGQWFGGLGVYNTAAAGRTGILEALQQNPSASLDLILGHLTTLSIPFAIPIGLLLSGALLTLKEKRKIEPLDALLVASGVVIAMMIALTLVFTAAVSGYDLGGLARWHSRYYFSIYPLLILVTAILIEKSRSEKFTNRWVVVAVVVLLIVANIWFTSFRSGLNYPWFGALADNMDVHWYRHVAWFFWPAIIGTLVVTVLWYSRNRWFNYVGAFATLSWLLVANLGVARTIDFGDPVGFDNCGKISALFLKSHPGRFAILADSRPSRVAAAFWNPYIPEKTLQVSSAQAPISLSTFAPTADYFIVNGDVPIDTPPTAVYSSGKCQIYESPR